jgi:hypothetical protein
MQTVLSRFAPSVWQTVRRTPDACAGHATQCYGHGMRRAFGGPRMQKRSAKVCRAWVCAALYAGLLVACGSDARAPASKSSEDTQTDAATDASTTAEASCDPARCCDADAAGGQACTSEDASLGPIPDANLGPGTGSDAAPGASDAGALGLGDAAVENLSDGLACYRLIAANCERRAECLHQRVSDECLARAEGFCPSQLLFTGSPFTNEAVQRCAAERRVARCEELLVGVEPACLSPGTLPAGAACEAGVQCESRGCVKGTPAVGPGVCAVLAAAGGACPSGTVCRRGETCVEEKCTPRKPPGLDDLDPPVFGAGSPCINNANCELGLYCAFVAATPGTGRCTALPSQLGPCAATQVRGLDTPIGYACPVGAYCGMDVQCHVAPPVGQPCGPAQFNGALHCAEGAVCNAAGRCEAWHAPGESCRGSSPTFMGIELFPECDQTRSTSCFCLDEATCKSDERRCLIRVAPGKPCDFPFARCLYGSQCVKGVCDYLPKTE